MGYINGDIIMKLIARMIKYAIPKFNPTIASGILLSFTKPIIPKITVTSGITNIKTQPISITTIVK
jgi:hypothetical protein